MNQRGKGFDCYAMEELGRKRGCGNGADGGDGGLRAHPASHPGGGRGYGGARDRSDFCANNGGGCGDL